MSGWVKCKLCPRECQLPPGHRGDCRVRINYEGRLISLVYGKPVSANARDPVEKKPVYHFLPGTRCVSIATVGCNLHCKFCQNHTISQVNPEDLEPFDLPPEQVVAAARRHQCPSISYTYSEPIVFFEYTRDTQALAHQQGIKNILVTAGYINEAPLIELCRHADAANVDLKAFSNDYYRELCAGTLAPVLRALELMVRLGVWVEVTNLIVPTLNDDMEMISRMCDWIAEKLGPEVPLHFSRFSPMYQLTQLPPTPADTLVRARETALSRGLKHVYVGNILVPGGGDTICPDCGNIVIARRGYAITTMNLENGACGSCGRKIAGVWK